MAPPTATTAFVLVPGAFCPASYYHRVTAKLTTFGYAAYETDLESVGERPQKGPATMQEDASHIHTVIASLLDQGKSVVLAANSYGGFIATEAARGLSRAEREVEGKPGGALVGLVFLASLLAPVGICVHELVGGHVPVKTESTMGDYIPPPDPETAGGYICSDLSEDEQRHYARLQRCHSAVSMTGRLTYAGYEHIPTTVLVSENDQALPPGVQHENVDAAIAKGLRVRKLAIRVGSHLHA